VEEVAATNEDDSAASTNNVPEGMQELVTLMAESTAATNEAAEVEAEPIAAETTPTNNVAETVGADSTISTNGTELTSDMVEPEPQEENGFYLLDNNGLTGRVFGWNVIGFGAGYTMTEDMGRYLDILTDVDFANIENVSSSAEVRDLVAMAAALEGIASPGNGFYMDATAGTSMRIGHFAIGARMFGEAAVWVNNLDTSNLGLAVADVDASISGTAGGDGDYIGLGGYTAENLSSTQQDSLTDAGLSQASVDYLDYQLGQLLADGTIEPEDLAGATDLLVDVVNASGGALADNQTAVVGRGFAMAEVPLSYGRAINENLSLGITAKAMFGRVLGTKIWVFDEDNLDNAVKSVTDTESDTLTFGIDLGALYRIKNFQFALVGHNLNRPTFDGYTDTVIINGTPEAIVVPDVKIDPQVTVGAAFIPSKRLCLETSLDLLETGTLLNGYDIQRFSVGTELDVWLLALRLGAYKNLAADWQDWVATAGVGLNFWACRFDIGGAYSLGDNAEYDGTEIPTEARIYAGLSIDF
ncbi:MAG: conjugal transfer protein TraF, partial [Verrucomicrobiota bacterium]